MLKPKGHFVEIDIGEKDCQQIKEIFDRGQNYGKWNRSRVEKITTQATKVGFQIIFAQDYFYNEYYSSYQDLDIFLQGVPIFEDFNPKKDRELLKKYVDQFSTNNGIQLERHRVVSVLVKP